MSSAFVNLLLRACVPKFPSRVQLRLSSSFKAALLTEPEKPLTIDTKSSPKLEKNQVRIQVHYCSVNSVDCASFSDGSKKLPFVPGYELSGEVIEVGKEVTNEQIICGEKVVALSLEKFGGFSEQCVVSIKSEF